MLAQDQACRVVFLPLDFGRHAGVGSFLKDERLCACLHSTAPLNLEALGWRRRNNLETYHAVHYVV